MENLEKFAKDCEIYHRAIERFAALGITDKEKVIIEMEKEIDMYREKLRDYEMSMKMDKAVNDLDEALAAAAGGPFVSGVLEVKEYDAQVNISIIKELPDDLRNRLASVTLDPEGRISLYFSEVDNGNDK